MKVVYRVLLSAALVVVCILVIGLGWFFFYSKDIPGLDRLIAYAPAAPAQEVSACSGGSISLVPYNLIGQNVINAARAAEGSEQNFALQIARSLFCNEHRPMSKRHLLEYRAFAQVRRKFSSEPMLTIYLNRAYFGDGGTGIENAAQHYYGRHSSELSVAQAAMIVGMLRAPNMYSPDLHPDGAKSRRNAVLAAMVSRGYLTTVEADAAMKTPVR